MKTTRTFLLTLLLLTSVFVFNAIGEDDDDAELRQMIAEGKKLHTASCVTACHGIEMYSRKNLFVKTYTQLEVQVKTCATRNNIKWDSDQTDNVIEYLASEFYKYD